jgi:hypothetical protein
MKKKGLIALTPRQNVIKTFFVDTDEEAKITEVCVPGKYFPAAFIFVNTARTNL